jgi:hypothetical protein
LIKKLLGLINYFLLFYFYINGDYGDWGLGIGDWGLGIGPNPQSPIPNPQSPIPIHEYFFKFNIFIFNVQI